MSEPSSSPELVPLREINADDGRARRQSEDAQSSGTDTGEEVPDHLPFVDRAVNFPLLCANIRTVIQGVLDVIPMPASVRTYLKIRWFGIFIATLLFFLIAMIAFGVLIFVVESSPEPTPIPDPFGYWAKDIGPNDRTTIRLPNIIAPITYRLFLYFHMNDTSRRFRYEGRVAITVEVLNVFENGDTFLIHAHKHLDVDFKNFIVTDDIGYVEQVSDTWESFPYVDEKGVLRTKDDSADAKPDKWKNFGQYEIPNVTRLDDDTLEVKLAQQLEERTQKIILIHFNGTMRDNPPGIFVRKMENSDDYWVATQFEPSLTRVAFPCFDEPEFRASFYLSIAHPPKYVALSNMVAIPDRPTSERASRDVGNVWSTFTPTPMMSPYLFGFVFGPFKSLGLNRTKTGPRIKMFALDQKDLIHRSVFTANITLQAMAFAAKYFELEYQMNKLYLVALPTTQPIDSECWGLILFREEAIFLNMTTASVDMLEKVARNVIHYIIHQWIGNIVGPAWWDDLWATEALVRYIEDDFIETIFPDWHVKENFGTQVIGGALNVDVLDKSHAVAALPRIPYYPVTMFDCLTSVKGAALFRMMDLFRPGSMKKAVRQHLRLRGGRQVVTNTLFQDIHYAVYPPNATAEEGLTIVKVMAKWTREAGYPLVTLVRYSGSSDVSLFQELFDPHIMISQQSLESHEISEKKCHKPGRHHRSQPSQTAWSLPIDLWTLNGSSLAQIDGFWLTTDYHRVCGGIPPRSRYILANYDQKGFFRVNYDEGNWQLIGHEMLHNPKIFSQITRAQLIDDAMAMAKVGRLNFVEALEMPLALLHQGVLGELTAGDVGMFERAMRAVADVHDCLRGSKLENDLLDYMRLLAASQWAAVDPPQRRKLERGNGHIDILAQRTSLLLQEQAIFWACYTDMTECKDWSVSLVREWQETHPTDRNAVEEHYSNTYCAAIRYGPDSFFDFLWNRYNQEGLSEKHKQEILWSLLCTTKRKKIMDVFGGLPGKRDLVEDTMLLWKKMEGRHIAAWYAFKYERSSWDNVHHRMYNSSFFNQIIIAITSALTTPSDLEEIQSFRVAHNQPLWDVQDLLEENVHNIRRRLYFRAIIEESLQAGLDEILPLAKAVKMQTDAARSPTPAPVYAYTEGKLEPATPHPVS